MSNKIELVWSQNLKECAPACIRAYRKVAHYLIVVYLLQLISVNFHGPIHLADLALEILLIVPITFQTIKEVSIDIGEPLGADTMRLTQTIFWRLAVSSIIWLFMSMPYLILIGLADATLTHKFSVKSGFALGVIAFFFSIFAPIFIWWNVKSTVASVLVCTKNAGIVESFRRSHELVGGNFWTFFKYLATNFCFVLFPIVTVESAVRQTLRHIQTSGNHGTIEHYALWVALILVEAINTLFYNSSILIQGVCLNQCAQNKFKNRI